MIALSQIDAIRLLDGARLPLVHPERPHDAYECINGKVYVRRPGRACFEPLAPACWPHALSLNLLDPAVFPTVDRRIVEAAVPRFAAKHQLWSLHVYEPIAPTSLPAKVWILDTPLSADLPSIGWYGEVMDDRQIGDAGRWYSDISYPDCPEIASIPFAPESLGLVRAALLKLFYPLVLS